MMGPKYYGPPYSARHSPKREPRQLGLEDGREIADVAVRIVAKVKIARLIDR